MDPRYSEKELGAPAKRELKYKVGEYSNDHADNDGSVEVMH